MAYLSVKMKDEPMNDQQPIASLQNLRSRESTFQQYPETWTTIRRIPLSFATADAHRSNFGHAWRARSWQERASIPCVSSQHISLRVRQFRKIMLMLFPIDSVHHEKAG